MKLTSFAKVMLFSVSMAAVAAPLAQGGPRGHKSKSALLDQNDEERYVMVTGSNLPQKVKVRSIGTTTPYNVRIYTRRELESTGRQTPGAALSALDPSIQLSGR